MKYHIVRERQDEEQRHDFSVCEPLWDLEEVVLPSAVLQQLEDILCFVKNTATLFDDWEFRRFMKSGRGLAVNFFGPPGTGKTITADAIAKRLQRKMIKVNYADLESKFLGETSKNLHSVFTKAKETESVLFFDEADAILSRRITHVAHAADHGINMAKSTLLTLLDSFSEVAIFATNLFENYDTAFIRRILFHVEFPVPDFTMRVRLWRFHLSHRVPRTVTYEKAAQVSEGLTGGAIRNIAVRLALQLLSQRIATIDEAALVQEVATYNSTNRLRRRPAEATECINDEQGGGAI